MSFRLCVLPFLLASSCRPGKLLFYGDTASPSPDDTAGGSPDPDPEDRDDGEDDVIDGEFREA